ncbi:hypothetical protein ACFXHA_12645 [Nocardia sp. NPDC059240]|uniref:hypothetical protein n=1 Tax=Nocardia sp. NPDC059240 TaxID=3346786 RepID=UPI00367C1561
MSLPMSSYYAASLPLIAGAVADIALLDAYRATNASQGTGPQLAVQSMAEYLGSWQTTGALATRADTWALALMFCGAAQSQAWTEHLAGPQALPRDRDARIRAVVDALIP